MTAKRKTNQQNLEYRREQAARLVGVDKGQIGAVSLQLRQLRSLGILVDIDVRGTSMFQRAASWAEWGIADEDVRHARLSGGVKLLIPAFYVKRLKSIETRFRQTLEQYSYSDVKAFAPFRFIPFTAYQEWRAEWDRLQDDQADVKADILKNYARFEAELAREFRAIGQRAWKNIAAQGYDRVIVGGREYESEADYVDYVVRKALSQMPTPEQIETGLAVDYRTALISSEADIEAELLAADRARAQRDELRREAEVQARADFYADQEARVKLEAMRQAEIEHARRRLAEMGSPLDEVVNALRARILKTAQSMLESVQKSGFVRGKVAEQGAGLLEFFDLMSVGSDERLRAKLYELKAAIGPIGKARTQESPERDVITVRETLGEIIAIAEQAAQSATVNSRFSNLEI